MDYIYHAGLLALTSVHLVLTFYGWGKIATKSLAFKAPDQLLMAIGMATLLGIGGVLVYFHQAKPNTLMAISVIGSVAAFCSLIPKMRETKDSAKSVIAINLAWIISYLILLSPLLLSSLGGFNETADKVGYAVHVERLLQTGGYGPDPFNSRIAESSLGGQNLLMGFLGSMGIPLYHMWVLERFIAPIVILFTASGLCKELSISANKRNVLLIGIIGMFYYGVGLMEAYTLTGTYTAIPLYLCLLWGLGLKEWRSWKACLIIALLLAGILSLKGTHLPIAGLLTATVLLTLSGTIKSKIVPVSAILGMMLVFLTAWALNLKLSNDTYFYPFLGKGYHGSQYGTYYEPSLLDSITSRQSLGLVRQALWGIIPSCCILFGVIVAKWRLKEPFHPALMNRSVLLGILIALGICSITLILATGFERYSFASIFIICILGFLGLSTLDESLPLSRIALNWGILWAFVLFSLNPKTSKGLRIVMDDASRGVNLSANYPETIPRSAVADAQDSIPAGEQILARMGQAYFLDFTRNPIWHIDLPGASSLPPGMPLGESTTPQELRSYFSGINVRYLMYSAADQGGHDVEVYQDRINSVNPWERYYSHNIVLFDALINRLGAEVIYNKNGLLVFDLDS